MSTSSLELVFTSEVFQNVFGRGRGKEDEAEEKDGEMGVARPVPVRDGNEVADESFLLGNFKEVLNFMFERGFKMEST